MKKTDSSQTTVRESESNGEKEREGQEKGASSTATLQMFNVAAAAFGPLYPPVITIVAECDRYLYISFRFFPKRSPAQPPSGYCN